MSSAHFSFVLHVCTLFVYRAPCITVQTNGVLGGQRAKMVATANGKANQLVTFEFMSAEESEEMVCELDKAVAAASSESGKIEATRMKARNDGAVLSPQLFQLRFGFLVRSLSDEDGSCVSQLCHAESESESDREAHLVPGVAYLSKRCLVFLPQRYSMCSCEESLRRQSRIFRLRDTSIALVYSPSDVGINVQRCTPETQRDRHSHHAHSSESNNEPANERVCDDEEGLGLGLGLGLRLWFGLNGGGEDFVAQVNMRVAREIARESKGIDDVDGGAWKASYLSKTAAELRTDKSFRKVVYGDRKLRVPLAWCCTFNTVTNFAAGNRSFVYSVYSCDSLE
jgi:hypothetical protein